MKSKIILYMILFSILTNLYANDEFDDEFGNDFDDEFIVEKKYDPLKTYNRFMTNINDKFYIHILIPTTKGYKRILPLYVRKSIKNIFNNLFYPIRFINNILQTKFKNSWQETQRFVINSTIGVLGIFDPAKTYFNLKPHNEDFGQTLGYWGISSGIPIVLPILGPSNLRDTLSLYPDNLINPIYYNDKSYSITSNKAQYIQTYTLDVINNTSFDVNFYKKLKQNAIDLYPFLRDSYEQRRNQMIKE